MTLYSGFSLCVATEAHTCWWNTLNQCFWKLTLYNWFLIVPTSVFDSLPYFVHTAMVIKHMETIYVFSPPYILMTPTIVILFIFSRIVVVVMRYLAECFRWLFGTAMPLQLRAIKRDISTTLWVGIHGSRRTYLLSTPCRSENDKIDVWNWRWRCFVKLEWRE